MVWYSHLFKRFPQFIMVHTVKGFDIVDETEVNVFLEFPSFLYNPVNVGNLISGSSSFSKITADGDCSDESERCLLLGRKVMTNLDSIFKSRDITLPTKVHLVKAMVFPVVMYGCESWTVKKVER